MSRQNVSTSPSDGKLYTRRALLALFLPLAAAFLVGNLTGVGEGVGGAAPFFAALAVVSWFLGLRWYGVRGMGLRGGRPLFAGIGFATMPWVALLLFRFIFPAVSGFGFGTAVAGRAFLYLLIFEAFALQLWAFGVFFRAAADWLGPLTAGISSGILFGFVASLLFQEQLIDDWSSLLFFALWGVLYGLIRLRTGSFLGIAIVQALQSFTTWVVLLPAPEPVVSRLQTMYVLTAAAYAIFIWRLWPKQEEDYRV
jgi:membrane protease YdiL (CAAX protease family)